MESSNGVEPEIDFSPVNKRRYEQYSSELCVFSFKIESVDSPQELEVRSLNPPYSLKTKSSQCHYVVMTRSETKFQAPLNRRYHEILAKTEHLTIKTMSTGHARHG